MPHNDEQSSINNDAIPTPPPNSSFHPAYAVTNIKNLLPVTSDQEEGQYATWVELFQIHACAFTVLDHIDASVPRPSGIDSATWNRLDAIVKQWIYGTISRDLVNTIMKPGASALELWNRLKEIFHDNKHTRAVYLEEQFTNTQLENFVNMAEYCKHIKLLADQLANVDRPVTDSSMVLQLIKGLPKGEYDTLAVMIQQADPIPSFNKARSQFLLEETRKAKQDEQSQHALVTQSASASSGTSHHAPSPQAPPQKQPRGDARGAGHGRGKPNNKGGKGRGRGKANQSTPGSQPQQQWQHSQGPPQQWAGPYTWQQPQPNQWASPL
ncbi:uncharacterized protein LOC110688551 [Chenopodium quinoa]|uniref:uncharacterized protein LOC110688551 n=1 Tax=Chenopodium quinoa TaxID=63459 RepID=UPI000B77DFEB|nr:uncharacterized protein LOC110688551 [Chenopodium quinoa]